MYASFWMVLTTRPNNADRGLRCGSTQVKAKNGCQFPGGGSPPSTSRPPPHLAEGYRIVVISATDAESLTALCTAQISVYHFQYLCHLEHPYWQLISGTSDFQKLISLLTIRQSGSAVLQSHIYTTLSSGNWPGAWPRTSSSCC